MSGAFARAGRRAALATALVVTSLQPVTQALAAPVEIFGGVEYKARECYGAETSIALLAGAKVLLKRDGTLVGQATIGEDGIFRTQVEGNEPVQATVVLESDKVMVTPLDKNAPYRIRVGEMVPGAENYDNVPRLDEYNEAAAANIFHWTNRAANVGVEIGGASLPPVRVRWDRDEDLSDWSPRKDISWSKYLPDKEDILIAGGKHHHEWDTFTLLHEYGHHLQFKLADPTGAKYWNEAGEGNHFADRVYPDAPGLAWVEGFANAFAAVVLGSPELKRDCGDFMDLGDQPATPKPTRPRLSQYNETAAAGVLYRLFDYFGGTPVAGVKMVLRAADQHRVSGHRPHSMRQVRDALITDQLEDDTYSSHQAIDDIFLLHGRMGWGFRAEVDFDDFRNKGYWAPREIALVLEGPYGRCKVASPDDNSVKDLDGNDPLMPDYPGTIGRKGGLPYTWEDDCLVRGGDGDIPENQNSTYAGSSIQLDFPYLADQSHHPKDFVLSAKYACRTDEESDQPTYHCTGTRRVDITVLMGIAEPKRAVDVFLPLDEKVDIVRFNAQGDCRILIVARSCDV